jgi:Fur family zinc uptake transcriptional regulator
MFSSSEIADRVNAARRFCVERGANFTSIREHVYALLLQRGGHASAYDLIADLGRDEGKAIGPPTVYRALEFLLEQGLISRLESRNSFVLCAHPGEDHDCLMFVCESCGRAQEVVDERVTGLLSQDAASIGFSPKRRIIEVEGKCAACARSD